jgi:tRNA A37 threonylcarbamoyladenosine biosynthesis protein TsaE
LGVIVAIRISLYRVIGRAAARPQMKKLIIAIDGPVGSGKTTVARRVAALLG